MSRIFRFGEYWSIETFFLLLFLGIVVSVCCRYAAPGDGGLVRRSHSTLFIKRVSVVYFCIFLVLWGMYTFRDTSVGADTETYIDLFMNASGFHFDLKRFLIFKQNELLYDLFTIGVRKITDSYVVYFSIIGIIIGYAYVRFFTTYWEKGKSAIFLILFVLVYQYNFGALRSAIGEMFLLLSLCQLVKKHTKKALTLSVIGGLFHYTIWINIFFIIFYKITLGVNGFNKLRLYIMTGASVAALGILAPILKSFFLTTRYRAYIPATNIPIVGYWYVFVSTVVAYILIRQNKYMGDEKLKIAITASFFSAILAFVASTFGAYRLVGYYALIRYYLWDRSADVLFHRKSNRMLYQSLMVCMVFCFLVYQLGRNSETPGFIYRLGGGI